MRCNEKIYETKNLYPDYFIYAMMELSNATWIERNEGERNEEERERETRKRERERGRIKRSFHSVDGSNKSAKAFDCNCQTRQVRFTRLQFYNSLTSSKIFQVVTLTNNTFEIIVTCNSINSCRFYESISKLMSPEIIYSNESMILFCNKTI